MGAQGFQPAGSIFAGGGEMGARMRAMDWAATPVGPVDRWPESLKVSVSTCLLSRFAILIWWGPELIKFYNDAYSKVLGRKHPRALAARGRDVWPEIWHIIGPMLEGVLERGDATWSNDLLLELDRSGYPEECYFTFSYSPIRDESGRVVGVFTPVQETTARVIGERRLRTLRDMAAASRADKSHTVQEAARVAVNVLSCNPYDLPFAALYLLSSGNEAVLHAVAGVTPGHPVAPRHIPLNDSGWLSAAASAQEPVVVLIPGDPQELPRGAWPVAPREAMVLPVLISGKRAGFLVAAISPRKRLDSDYRDFLMLVADQITSAIAEASAFEHERLRAESLAELDRAKTAFFSNVSHEFRTPLALLLGPLQELLERRGGQLETADWQQLELAHRNALRLLKLVNNLLDFSRIEAGGVRGVFEATDLSQFTSGLVSVFRSAIERAGMHLTADCEPLPAPVYVDRDMWEKIVLNLISNAFKFTHAGGVTVTLCAEEEHAVLRVADTGIGIAADQLPRLFERFHRVEDGHGRTQEGSGIGLALVHELVKIHGGTITVHSVSGRGSVFCVRIPMGIAHLPADQVGSASSPAPIGIPVNAYLEEAMQWISADRRSVRPADKVAGRILLVDDNADMRTYIEHLLRDRYSVQSAASGHSALDAALADPPDLVIADVMMPGFDGFELLRALRSNPRTATVPVMLLSARAGEESRVEGLESGADDYLIKPFTARELVARVAAHLELSRLRRKADERFRKLYASRIVGIVSSDSEKVYDANDAFLSIIGYTREDLETGRICWRDITPPEYAHLDERCVEELFAEGSCKPYEKECIRKDGTRVPILIGATLLEQAPPKWVCFVLDITERKQLEKRLFEKQKLESIGLLAGGIAHDFNNLLVGILGNASLIQETLPPGSVESRLADELVRASERAAHLTGQMLAYAGKGRFVVEPVNLNLMIEEVVPLLRPSLPAKVTLRLELSPALPVVEADANQIKQIVTNLALNAAEAMGANPGTVAIRTYTQTLRSEDIPPGLADHEIEPGRYIALEVRDTGAGMDQATIERIFDPFFTTKFTGRGLGLAAVAGIVRAHRGMVGVKSAPGEGSVFTVLLPAAGVLFTPVEEWAPAARELDGTGRVLIVDDEPLVRQTARYVLERHGYSVLEADCGRASLVLLRNEPGPIDLVILDLSMPGMRAEEVLPELLALRPDLKVIVSSGYSEAEAMSLFPGTSVSGFLHKPYTAVQLAERVKGALAGGIATA